MLVSFLIMNFLDVTVEIVKLISNSLVDIPKTVLINAAKIAFPKSSLGYIPSYQKCVFLELDDQ